MKYNIALRILHWLMAIFILGMIAAGMYMTELPKEDTSRDAIYALHKSFGALIFFLFFIRVAVRFSTKIPPLPSSIPPSIQKLAQGTQFLIYALILIVPLSGIAMSNMYGYPVNMFGWELPRFFSTNKETASIAREMHEVLPYILLGLIGLHFAGALKHKFFDKPENDILKRMI